MTLDYPTRVISTRKHICAETRKIIHEGEPHVMYEMTHLRYHMDSETAREFKPQALSFTPIKRTYYPYN